MTSGTGSIPREEHKLVVVGSGGVGKSSLTIQFFQRMFLEDYDPTIEDSYTQNRDIDKIPCQMEVLDTAGQEEYGAMREQYMRKGDGFMIVYSVIDRTSFDQVERFHMSVLRAKDCEQCPMIICANKVDLFHRRTVTEEEGRSLAEKLKIPYLETSAKNPPINVDQAFDDLVRLIRRDRATRKPSIKPVAKKASRKKKCTIL